MLQLYNEDLIDLFDLDNRVSRASLLALLCQILRYVQEWIQKSRKGEGVRVGRQNPQFRKGELEKGIIAPENNFSGFFIQNIILKNCW